MQNRRPAQFNIVPNDPSGNTWALPKDAIVRFGKGLMNRWDVKLSPDGTHLASSGFDGTILVWDLKSYL